MANVKCECGRYLKYDKNSNEIVYEVCKYCQTYEEELRVSERNGNEQFNEDLRETL